MRRKHFLGELPASFFTFFYVLPREEMYRENKAEKIKRNVQASCDEVSADEKFKDINGNIIKDSIIGRLLIVNIKPFDYYLSVDSGSQDQKFRPYDRNGWLHVWINEEGKDCNSSFVYIADKGLNEHFDIIKIRFDSNSRWNLERLLNGNIHGFKDFFDNKEFFYSKDLSDIKILNFFNGVSRDKTNGLYTNLFQRIYENTLNRVIGGI